MRTFVGIEIGSDLRSLIATACTTIREQDPAWTDQKWVPAQNLHVTLKFLGDMSAESVSTLAQDIAEKTADLSAFTLPIGCFIKATPNPRTARMLWTTLDDPDGHCTILHQRIEDAVFAYGVLPDTRSFSPHITLCRARKPRRFRPGPYADIAHIDQALPSVSVRTVTVFKSVLTSGRPYYERISYVGLAD